MRVTYNDEAFSKQFGLVEMTYCWGQLMVSLALLIFIYQIFAKKWKHVSVGILFRGDKKQRHNDYWWGRWIGQEYTAISISGRDHWLITSAALGQFTFCRIILCIWQYYHLDLDLDQGYPPSSATITILRKPQDTTLVIFSQNGGFSLVLWYISDIMQNKFRMSLLMIVHWTRSYFFG